MWVRFQAFPFFSVESLMLPKVINSITYNINSLVEWYSMAELANR